MKGGGREKEMKGEKGRKRGMCQSHLSAATRNKGVAVWNQEALSTEWDCKGQKKEKVGNSNVAHNRVPGGVGKEGPFPRGKGRRRVVGKWEERHSGAGENESG